MVELLSCLKTTKDSKTIKHLELDITTGTTNLNTECSLFQVVRAGPWDKAPPMRIESIDEPCPPCQVPIQVQCLGKHEVSNFVLYMVRGANVTKTM
jgi:hypothetical protein